MLIEDLQPNRTANEEAQSGTGRSCRRGTEDMYLTI